MKNLFLLFCLVVPAYFAVLCAADIADRRRRGVPLGMLPFLFCAQVTLAIGAAAQLAGIEL